VKKTFKERNKISGGSAKSASCQHYGIQQNAKRTAAMPSAEIKSFSQNRAQLSAKHSGDLSVITALTMPIINHRGANVRKG
jgi:hypothetical protein